MWCETPAGNWPGFGLVHPDRRFQALADAVVVGGTEDAWAISQGRGTEENQNDTLHKDSDSLACARRTELGRRKCVCPLFMNRRQFLQLTPAAALAQTPGGSVFKAGFAERDITPDIGHGAARRLRQSLSPQLSRCLQSAGGRFRRRPDARGAGGHRCPDGPAAPGARGAAGDRRALRHPAQAVLIGASHSHSSGPTGMIQPGEYDDADPFVRQLAYEKSSCADAAYLERVRAEIVTAVCHADSLRVEARCGFGSGRGEPGGLQPPSADEERPHLLASARRAIRTSWGMPARWIRRWA